MRKSWQGIFFSFLLLVAFPKGSALAQDSQSKGELQSEKEEFKPSFNLQFNTTFSSNFYKFGSSQNQSGLRFELSPSYTLKKGLFFQGYLLLTKDLKVERKLELGTSFLGVKKSLGPYFNDSLSVSLNGRVYLPTVKTARRNGTFKFGTSFYPSLTYNFEKLGISGTSFTYQPRFKKNFHKYNFSYSGGSNSSYQFLHYFILSNYLTDKFSISNAYIYVQSWSYLGSRKMDQYILESSIGYQINKNFSLVLGHSLNGGIYGPDGVSNNIQLFDERDSTYFLTLGISL